MNICILFLELDNEKLDLEDRFMEVMRSPIFEDRTLIIRDFHGASL